MWPLLALAIIGLLLIAWKLSSLMSTSNKTRSLLEDVDGLISNHRLEEAKARCRESDTPVANILLAGLDKHDQGTERVMTAIENEGMIQMSRLESGLVWLATIANVAPLLGFLGTVAGMIIAFGAIELAGEVDATLVAGGIKVALITTATGLAIAIPVNIAHNWFVSQIDDLIVDMRQGVQSIQDLLWAGEQRPAPSPPPAGGPR